MSSYYDPEDRLSNHLDSVLSLYESDFEEYWGLTATEAPDEFESEAAWERAKVLNHVGKQIVASAYGLSLGETLLQALRELQPGDAPAYALREAAVSQVAYDRVEIDLAWQAIHAHFDARDRLHQVILLLTQRRPTERAAAYLDRTVRLYLWGFDAEVAILCRSTLEAALEERIDEKQMEGEGYRSGRFGFSAKQYIDAAESLGIFAEGIGNLAHDLRSAGNAAVHAAPGLEVNAFDLLFKLWILLNLIFEDGHD